MSLLAQLPSNQSSVVKAEPCTISLELKDNVAVCSKAMGGMSFSVCYYGLEPA